MKRLLCWSLTVLTLVASLASCGSTDTMEQRLARRAEELRVEHGLPGMQVALAGPDGEVVAVAVGLADSTDTRAMTIDHFMPAGSVGKTGLAAVVLSLVHDGVLDLDAPVSRWLGDEDWFARLPNAGPELTLRRLMNHAGGLPDHLKTPQFAAHCDGMLAAGGDPDDPLPPREAVSFILDAEPLFAPGTSFRYTDTAYLVAGLAAEKASGRAYYDLLRERFLAPLDLAGIVAQDRRDLPHLANGYSRADLAFAMPPTTLLPDGRLNHNPVLEWTGGGLVTRTADLARWIRLLYGGHLMDWDYLPELLRGQTLPADWKGPGHYGLAVFVQDSPRGEVRWHSGFYPGYNTMARYWPDRDSALAVQVNRDHDTHLEVIAAALAEVALGP